MTASVGIGGSYTIADGYHNGSGKVTGPTLDGNAAVGNVLSGKTFYSNSGTKQTGTMTNRGAVTASVGVGGTYTIPAGYHNGSGKISGPTLDGNAQPGQVLSGRTFYNNSGVKQTGTIATKAAESTTITPASWAQSYTFATSGKYCSGNMTVTVPAAIYSQNVYVGQVSGTGAGTGKPSNWEGIKVDVAGTYRIFIYVMGYGQNNHNPWIGLYINNSQAYMFPLDDNSAIKGWNDVTVDRTLAAGDVVRLGNLATDQSHYGFIAVCLL